MKGGAILADNILVMDHITKEFPGVKALDNVNLEVQRGEIHALIGEKRCGKIHTDERFKWSVSIWKLYRYSYL